MVSTRREICAFGIAATSAAMVKASPLPARDEAASLAHVDPELRDAARQTLALAATMPAITTANLATLRATGAAMAEPVLPDVPLERRTIPGGRGAPPVSVLVVNRRQGGRRPAILHTHGGGYILGAAQGDARYLQELARDLDCVIVSVDYRLAPEARFTASVEDNDAGLRWLFTEAASLGVDPGVIAIMGESAGGGHAALLAIAARDRGEVPVVLQVLIYPMLDDRTGSTRPVAPFVGTIGWNAEANRYGWSAFLGATAGGDDVPAAGVPARQASLAGLPPAFVAVGGIDLFVDEDVAYAARLTDAGVPTELLVVPGAFHAFDRVAPASEPAIRFRRARVEALRRAFRHAAN